jgi:peptidyl-tRNA hydrolase, PTH1 family
MKIVCGLGNPGREYSGHRHNIGFMVVEALASRLKASFDQEKFESRLASANLGSERLLLLMPQTFMNLSGRALGSAARFYKVPAVDVLVVHDELDLPFGKCSLKSGGGTGGHNGLNSMAEHWGEKDYGRLRMGIGKPEGPNAKDRVVGHVLGDFSKEESKELDALIGKGVEGCELWLKHGMQTAMNRFNRK